MKKLTAILATFIISLGTVLFAQDYNAQEKFFIEYSQQQKATQDRLVLVNKKGNMAKLGEETINGLISGTLHYKTSVQGLKGIVTMTYDNYCDVDGWIFNGTITTKANMSADGTLGGIVSVTNKGSINYDKVIIKDGKAAGGTYGVTLPDGTKQDIKYELVFVACPDLK